MSDDERNNFCRRLKIMRERKGIALATIADATKIRASLFEAFERNDLRAWPVGLYRRAYFREYARHFDDRLDESCEEFNKLFTDEPEAAPAVQTDAPPARPLRPPDADLRLALDTKWHGPRAAVLSRLAAAVADIFLVAILSGVMMLASGFDAAVTIAAVALAYFSLGTALFGGSPATWMIAHREAIMAVFVDAERKPAEPVEEGSEPRPWVSDATRVGPAPPSQLRVRFKL